MRQILTLFIYFLFCNCSFSQLSIKYFVFFDFNEFELSPENKEKLARIGSEVKSKKITLKGYADSTGNATYNLLLSKKRVSSVKTFLLNHGIPETQFLNIEGLGECVLSNDNSRNRMVEIILETPSKNLIEPIIDSNNFIPKPKIVTKKASKEVPSLNGTISKLEVGDYLPIKNIEFVGGKKEVHQYSLETLEQLFFILKENSNLKIQIEGHTHQQKKPTDGMLLSKRRAKTVYKYLVKKGIPKERLRYKGFASTRPVDKEKFGKSRQRNMRVEILILDK